MKNLIDKNLMRKLERTFIKKELKKLDLIDKACLIAVVVCVVITIITIIL